MGNARASERAEEEAQRRCLAALADQRPEREITISTHTLRVSQKPCAFATGLRVWSAAEGLAAYVVSQRGPFKRLQGRRVCELGAGCGVPGMACALRGASVTLTDHPELLEHLSANVAANVPGSVATVLGYEWGSPPVSAGLEPPYDMIIGADLLMNAGVVEPLIAALTLLSDEKTICVLACELRDPPAWEALCCRLRGAFGRVSFVRRSELRRALTRAGLEPGMERWVKVAVLSRKLPTPAFEPAPFHPLAPGHAK